MHSPSIWLCLQCGRCADACGQLVDGRSMIREIRDMAISKGVVDKFFLSRLETADQILYSRYLDQVDAIFGLPV